MTFQDDEMARVAALFRTHGMTPSWMRAWRDGVDVTAEPPETWGPPYSWYVQGRRGEGLRREWLALHAAALAESSSTSTADTP